MAKVVISGKTPVFLAAAVFVVAIMTLSLAGETPLGSLRGRIAAADTGRPLAGARISLVPVRAEGSVQRLIKSRSDGSFSVTTLAAGDYKIQIDTPAHHLPSTLVTVEEGKATVFDAELSPKPSFMDLVVHQHVYTPRERPSIACKGFTQADVVQVSVYRADMDVLLKDFGGNLARLLNPKYDYMWSSNRHYDLEGNKALSLVKTVTQPIMNRDLEGIYYQRVSMDDLLPGMYVLEARADKIERFDWLMVTNLALVTKQVGNSLLAYTAGIVDGRPVGGAAVEVYQGKELIGSGITDSSGLLDQPLKLVQGAESNRLIVGKLGDSVAFTSSYIYRQEGRKARTIYSYTDRPVYRPGQQVFYKGIVRRFDTDKYVTPEPEPVEVEVRDRFGNVLQKVTTMTNRFGSYFGSLTLPEGAATGYYSITARVAGVEDESGFEVAEYRKPEFSAEVKPLKARYVRGEVMVFRVSAGYYFGAPVVRAPVKFTVTRNPYWFTPESGEYEYEAGEYEGCADYGGYGEEVLSGEVRTNNQGIAYIKVPARWEPAQNEEDFDSDQEYSVSVVVADAGRREADADASVVATRGSFAVVSEARAYIVSPGGNASVDIRTANYNHTARQGVRVKVTAGQQIWTENEVDFRPEVSREVTTDFQGKAVFNFSPREAGQYKLVYEAADERGNIIRSSDYLWVTDSYGTDLNYKYPELDVVPDKRIYKPGETARVLVNSERSGVTALVTVEGEKLFDYRLVELGSRSTIVDIPIKDNYRPNVFINVGYIHNKEFVQRQERVRVTLKERRLNVSIKANKSRYLPGEQAAYTVKVSDSEGRPVAAELSLGVVDEAIYSIRPDRTQPILDFFYHRQNNNVRTDFSSPQVYLSDADKSGFTGKVRQNFMDTAFWSPSILTNEHGIASVSLSLPDNLTTWRATVRAITVDTAAGEATSKAICSKDLLVRLETPRFLTQRDEAEITGVVHNYTPEARTVSVALRCSNIQADGDLDRKVKVGAGGSRQIQWRVRAPDAGKCEIGLYAQAGILTDAVKIRLPIHPHGQERVSYYTGALAGGGKAMQKITVRQDSIRNKSEVIIRLSPSLAGTLIGGLKYLADYPYGCTEQTMSRFLPDVVIWKTLKDLGVSNRELEMKLPDMVSAGLLKLYSYQHEDGGWGWYEYDRTDGWMTAYVVYGLLTAREAGFAVNADILSRGISALRQRTFSRPQDAQATDDVFSLYALSIAGTDVQVGQRVRRLYERRGALSDQGLAFLALALDRMEMAREAKAVIDQLVSRANESSTFLFWTSDADYYETPAETAGVALMAAMKVRPDDPRVPKIVNWVIRQRRDNHWVSTRDTAMALYGLSAYLQRTKELEPDALVSVVHNGKTVANIRLNRNSLFAPEHEVKLGPGLLRTGANNVEIRTIGRGNVYYTIKCRQYVAREDVPLTLTSSGISVKREYYRLIPKWDDQMLSTSFVPAPQPAVGFRSGDCVRVKLTIDSPRRYDYVLIEDRLPAGCEAVDAGKKYAWEWRNWWAAEEIRDDRVSFYADYLPEGRSVIQYEIRALSPGEYHAMPCEVYAMYEPAVRAATAETRVRLK